MQLFEKRRGIMEIAQVFPIRQPEGEKPGFVSLAGLKSVACEEEKERSKLMYRVHKIENTLRNTMQSTPAGFSYFLL